MAGESARARQGRPVKADLESAYRATTYRVEGPDGNIDIRVGRLHPPLDALLARLGARDWAFITAWNPRSMPTSAEANSRAQAGLLQFLRERDFVCFEGDGIPDHPRWTPERSVWIAGMDRRTAAELGTRFGQNAVVVGSVREAALLLFCDRDGG